MFLLQKLLKWNHLFAIIVFANMPYELYSSDKNPKNPLFSPHEPKKLMTNNEKAKEYQKTLLKKMIETLQNSNDIAANQNNDIAANQNEEEEEEEKNLENRNTFRRRASFRELQEKLKNKDRLNSEEIEKN